MISKKTIFPTLFVLACLNIQAQDAVPATGTDAPVPAVADAEKPSAQQLYEQALAEREAGEPKQAVQTAAQVVALYDDDKEWIAKTELLCAELYIELGLTNAADVTARQVQQLHEGTEEAVKATELRAGIEKSKESE